MPKIMGSRDDRPDGPTEHDRATGNRRRAIELIDIMAEAIRQTVWDAMPGATEAGRRYNDARRELLTLIASDEPATDAGADRGE